MLTVETVNRHLAELAREGEILKVPREDLIELATFWLEHQCDHSYVRIGEPYYKRDPRDENQYSRDALWQPIYCQHCKDHDEIPVEDHRTEAPARRK